MFNSLTGIITGKFPQKLLIDTHGIEWDITVPDSALDKFSDVGQRGTVFTWMQHTDMLMILYGFASEIDRSVFLDLLKVDGIGPKGAIKIMSNVSSEQLSSVLDSGDVSALEKIPGVGKKTAGKMLLQLKGKLSLDNVNPVITGKANTIPFADVINALTNMGYDRHNAEQCVGIIVSELEKDVKLKDLSPKEKEDTVFRRAIVELAQ